MPSNKKLKMEEVTYHEFIEEIEKTLNEHVKSWEVFFRTLAEQVWNVPNFVPMMNIQREWEFAEGLGDEVSNSCCFNK